MAEDAPARNTLNRSSNSKAKRSSDRPAPPAAETIWVGVRIRPLSYLEHIHRDRDSWEASDEFTLRYIGEVDRSHAHLPPAYCYDRVFSNHSSSQQVYEAAAKDRVLSALQGLNATLFVYGQTGSGKTYTMRSVVQAAAQDIFHHIRHTPGRAQQLHADQQTARQHLQLSDRTTDYVLLVSPMPNCATWLRNCRQRIHFEDVSYRDLQ